MKHQLFIHTHKRNYEVVTNVTFLYPDFRYLLPLLIHNHKEPLIEFIVNILIDFFSLDNF
jgi:hypothetical protein